MCILYTTGILHLGEKGRSLELLKTVKHFIDVRLFHVVSLLKVNVYMSKKKEKKACVYITEIFYKKEN